MGKESCVGCPEATVVEHRKKKVKMITVKNMSNLGKGK
jgi:hypothetical protein